MNYFPFLHELLPFQVHTRFWPCLRQPKASCACGFVAKENYDVISIDMCDGQPGKTAVQISILSGTVLAPGVQITKANQGKRFSVISLASYVFDDRN